MVKKNFLVRIVQQCVPSSACEQFDFYFDTQHDAFKEFQVSCCEALICEYIKVELCELDSDSKYYITRVSATFDFL